MSFANDYFLSFEVKEYLSYLCPRRAYQVSQLPLGESDPDEDSAGVLYAKLKGQLEQRHRDASDQVQSEKARIATHQIPPSRALHIR